MEKLLVQAFSRLINAHLKRLIHNINDMGEEDANINTLIEMRWILDETLGVSQTRALLKEFEENVDNLVAAIREP